MDILGLEMSKAVFTRYIHPFGGTYAHIEWLEILFDYLIRPDLSVGFTQ